MGIIFATASTSLHKGPIQWLPLLFTPIRKRLFIDNMRLPDLDAALAALDKLEAEVIERQRVTAQPKPHHYELMPQ